MIKKLSKSGRIVLVAVPLALLSSAVLLAQIEGPKRGIAPIASTGDFEVAGIEVEGKGNNADEARRDGWEKAQRIAWQQLWAKNRGGAGGKLSDSALNGIVTAIVVEEEQIGPRRYVAKLGVVFDRARAGQLLGVKGITRRSAPLIVIPIMWDGGAPISFERRTAWQNAWAKFKTADSKIDYVRPHGGGGDSLLLNAGQIERRSRTWWRTILDQFGAADVLFPVVKLDRRWPGGPVIGKFSARYGPDNKYLGSFELRASDSKAVPAMMAQGTKKMDELYQAALAAGRLRTESSLVFERQFVEDEDLDEAPVAAGAVDEGDNPAQLDTEPLDVLDQAADGTAPATPAPTIPSANPGPATPRPTTNPAPKPPVNLVPQPRPSGN